MLAHLKKLLKQRLRRSGYELYRRPWLPRGVDPWETLHAIFPSWHPRAMVDVGANVGETALRLAAQFPTAEVHAIEPVAATHAALTRNTAACPRIHPHHLAISDHAGPTRIRVLSESTLNSLEAAPPAAHDSEEITLLPLDEFCATHGLDHLDLLKTDTEGHELSVLRGASALLARGAIDTILVEAGLVPGDPRFVLLPEIAGALQPQGLLLVGIFDQHGWRNRHGAEFCNALFVRGALLPA